jgi:hypothetical protein
MSSLYLPNVGVRDLDELIPAGRDGYPVQRCFVGVEGNERGGRVGFRGGALQVEDDTVRGDVKLLDPNSVASEALFVKGREVHEEGAPFTVSEGKPDFAGVSVEVKGVGVGSKKESADVRNTNSESPPEAMPIPVGQREREARRYDRVLPRKMVDEGPVASESRERAPGGFPREERLAKDLIGQDAIIGHQGKEWEREGKTERNHEAAKDRHAKEAGGG